MNEIAIYMTDFGDVELCPEFVAEAKRKWPGSIAPKRSWLDVVVGHRPPSAPEWEAKVGPAINALMQNAYASGACMPRKLKCLRAVESYL